APLSILNKKPPRQSVNNLIEAELLHFGIGLQSTGGFGTVTGSESFIECTFDYDLVSGNPLNAILPSSISGNTLTWSNQASVYLGNSIDRNYWYNSTYITTINNNTLQQWQQLMINYGTRNPFYSVFSLSPPPVSRDSTFAGYARSST